MGTKADLGLISNPNLLDNWYFADPINQRGQTTYKVRNYTIDRWLMGFLPDDLPEGAIFTVHPGKYSEWSGNVSWLIHRFPNTELTGEMMTMSVLFADGTLLYGSAIYNMVDDMSVRTHFFDMAGVMSAFAQSDETAGQWRVVLTNYSVSPLKIVAVKLELGSMQTLARQDASGKWVLRAPPPDPALELAKCQRYYYRGKGWHYLLKNGSTNSQTVTIDFPVTMRATPEITLVNGENMEEITTDPTANCLLAYKNGDTSTMLGIYEFVADANL